MYKDPHFTETNGEVVIAFMKENYFAIITASGKDFPVVTQLPLHIDEKDGKIFLTGHMMKYSDHYKIMSANENVLVIFNGPYSYVSASWYAEEPMGSTFNYMTVHAKGKIKFQDEAAAIAAVKKITELHEGFDNKASFDKLPNNYVSGMVKAISAFEIEITNLENVFKLSQNRTTESRKNIAAELMKKDDTGSKKIAEEILKRV
ncbi:MAG: FMN-binding negative transcriptional regulator [Ferruginibacter sp.]